MRKLREIIRLRLECGLSGRAIARSCGLSPGTVQDYLGRIVPAGLVWPLPPELDDDEALERLLFPHEKAAPRRCPEPDFAHVHRELRRKHVTKLLLWQEYREQHPDGYQYSRFCELYDRWSRRVAVTMRQVHRAGEKVFVDFSGDGLDIVDPRTGGRRRAKLFVGVLGGSSLTYVEPVLSEDLPSWIGCHVRMFEYFGGVPEVVVPDNLKSGVRSPCRYEPQINPTYAELARHYGVAVIPGRVRKPRDKAKAEAAVLVAERWILAVLRNRTFHTLEELREAIRPLLERLNARPMRHVGRSRRELFEELERATLKPLPDRPYELATWKRAKVNIDYHVELEGSFYSVPYTLAGETVELRATAMTVEVILRGRRVASHLRTESRGRYTTVTEHMPKSHRAHLEWTPSRIVSWARSIGPSTGALVEEILRRYRHPEQGYRSCLGIIRLQKRFGTERLEAACDRALRFRALSYRSVQAILKNNRDRIEDAPPEPARLPAHGNVRGSSYYH